MKKRIVCILGVDGFVGSCLLKFLLKKDYLIRVYTRRLNTSYFPGIEVYRGSIHDKNLLFNFLDGCNIIYNCLGSYGDFNKNQINIDVPYIITDLISSMHFDTPIHWVQLSSAGIYGGNNIKANLVINEDSKIQPNNFYEYAKLVADNKIIGFSYSGLMTYTIIRPTNIIGFAMPNNSLRDYIKIINIFLPIRVGFFIPISNYVHVNDVCAALVISAESHSCINNTFIISNDCDQIATINAIKKILNIKIPTIIFPIFFVKLFFHITNLFIKLPITKNRISAITNRIRYSSNKFYENTGFRPSVSIDDGIYDVIKSMNFIR